MFTSSVPIMTPKLVAVTVGDRAAREPLQRRARDLDTTNSRKTKMPAAASVSYFRWPYG